MRRAARALLVSSVAAALLLAGPASAATDDRAWRSLLDRASEASERLAYVGESLLVTYEDGEPSVSTFIVQSTGKGEISVTDRTRYAVRLSDDGGSLADHERGWFFPLPAADLAKAHKGLNRVAAKYDVEIVGKEHLLDRPCTRIEISRRADERLVERLWVDDASGLLLRRETYAGEKRLLRMVAYLKLDLNPRSRLRAVDEARPGRGPRPSGTTPDRDASAVDETGRAALREAGWFVPEEMPGEYMLDGSFALTASGTQPLQTVYSDGLYTLSLFEQRGRLDPATLPDGAEVSTEYGFDAYVWPGAVPQRLVWEAAGSTWSLVGDAPPDDFAAIVDHLPEPESESVLTRIGRGLGRLWSWVSPWS